MRPLIIAFTRFSRRVCMVLIRLMLWATVRQGLHTRAHALGVTMPNAKCRRRCYGHGHLLDLSDDYSSLGALRSMIARSR